MSSTPSHRILIFSASPLPQLVSLWSSLILALLPIRSSLVPPLPPPIPLILAKGAPYEKKTSKAVCDELGPSETYMKDFVMEKGETDLNLCKLDGKGCNEKEVCLSPNSHEPHFVDTGLIGNGGLKLKQPTQRFEMSVVGG